MISKFVVLLALTAVALCAIHEPIEIVSQDSDMHPDGMYRWSYESADGTHQAQHGEFKPIDKDTVAETVQGVVQWTDPEGGKHEINYVADENGFKPQGADVPVAPAVPPQIARALDWNAAHPEPMEMTKKL